MGQLNTDELDWAMTGDVVTLAIGATTVPRLLRMLKGRLPFDQPLVLRSSSKQVGMASADEFNVHDAGEGELHVDLPTAATDAILATLRPVAGTYPITQRLLVDVRKSVITDQGGREVEVIG